MAAATVFIVLMKRLDGGDSHPARAGFQRLVNDKAPNAPISTALIFSTYQRLVLISPGEVKPHRQNKDKQNGADACIRLPRRGRPGRPARFPYWVR
jgi:hypothetical protein